MNIRRKGKGIGCKTLLATALLSGRAVAFSSHEICSPRTNCLNLRSQRRWALRRPLVVAASSRDDDVCRGADLDQHPPAPGDSSQSTRRDVLRQSAASLVTSVGASALASTTANALPNPLEPTYKRSDGGVYKPAKRCTAYLVDSTVPPSLIPYRASREAAILKGLGAGSGTQKSALVADEVNLNNFMNKAVFGSINAVKNAVGNGGGSGKSGPNYQSFVFLGANFDNTFTADPEKTGGMANADAELAVQLLTDITKPKERNGNTAVGLAFAPQASQGALDEYLASSASGDDVSERKLADGLRAAGANEDAIANHVPIMRFARQKRLALLALAPDTADIETISKGGLQSLSADRRDAYVTDAQGFISLTQEPKFKLYSQKSLLKDAPQSTDESTQKSEQANFFAERILVHEAAATAVSRWATSRPDSLVVTVAPIPDVRFLGGMNGRVPRICKFLNPGTLVTDEAVTTILLNPSAKETLSESRWLRLEIGTAPNNWEYQTKVADYLWFSSSPKVNMIPRMMNEQ